MFCHIFGRFWVISALGVVTHISIKCLFILELLALRHTPSFALICHVSLELHRGEFSWAPQSAGGGPELPGPSIDVGLLDGAAQQDYSPQHRQQSHTGLGAELHTHTHTQEHVSMKDQP